MIIEIPDENSIVKWKNDDKDEWKVAEISDLIKAYERPQGEWIKTAISGMNCYECNKCHCHDDYKSNFCYNCGAKMGNIK